MQSDRRRLQLRLDDMLSEIGDLLDGVAGLEYETFATVWVVRRASERAIEIISEASRHIPDDLKALEPEIPWRQIAGIGNVLRHDYEAVSDRVIWDIIKNHLAPLENAVRRLLNRIETGEGQK